MRRTNDFLFPSATGERPLSNMSLLVLLRRMGFDTITAHGFRATFRTWVAERTAMPREVAEAALAHTVGSKVERAYQRGDFLEKRRILMALWADFCATPYTQNETSVQPFRAVG